MKWLAFLIITASLVFGTISATTAYLPTLDAAAAADTTLTLTAPAGQMADDPTTPLVEPGPLTDEAVTALSDAGVTRVRVKEFSFARWDLWWLFALSVVGFFVGAAIVRQTARAEVAAAGEAASKAPEESPEAALENAAKIIETLRADLDGMTDEHAKMALIVERLDVVHDEHFEAFLEAQVALVGRLGMAGYAQLMDKFAGAERVLNRAWSAAADHVPAEAVECLEEGARRLEVARERLK